MLYFDLKSYIKNKFPLIRKFKSQIFSLFDESSRSISVKPFRVFTLYIPYTRNSFKKKTQWIFESINKVFPLLYSLGKYVKDKDVELQSIEKQCSDPKSMSNAEDLKKIFDKFGSAKHDYHYFYSAIFKNPSDVKNIFEIGIGNNDTYNNIDRMGEIACKPGSALRAFREYFRNANIYGADVVKEILFQEERIKTFFVDQTIPATFNSLLNLIPNNFDLVIDDGLHTPHANIASLEFGLKIVKVGGWVVIEDIGTPALDLWKVVALFLPDNYKSHIFLSKYESHVFAVKRLS
jgi:SAM-dependent methyltransferase